MEIDTFIVCILYSFYVMCVGIYVQTTNMPLKGHIYAKHANKSMHRYDGRYVNIHAAYEFNKVKKMLHGALDYRFYITGIWP